MHILHIASGDLWAGAEVQIFSLLSQLVKNSQQVSAIVFNEGRLADELAAVGINVVVIPESKFGFKGLIQEVRHTLLSLEPDIVHTHRQKEHIVGSIANRISLRVPCVRTVHGSPEFSPSFKQRVQTALDIFCGRYLQHAVISVDGELTKKLAARFSRKKISTIPNGIDIADTLNKASQYQQVLDENVKHVAIVGRLEPVKRVDLFLQMANIMLQSRDRQMALQFHVFGSGSLATELADLAKQLSVFENVTFHGHTDAIQSWIKQLDVVVMPSDHEGLPMTALECLALAKPLVAHAVGGLIPLLSEAFPSGLVEEHTPAAYAEATFKALYAESTIKLPSQYDAAENARHVTSLYQALISA
ncbi:glycosyltransferase [Alteromonas sp. ASW11-130]|uniref:glycosyltransferase n=1 Tax=Alteromonas sp. ASW11-130 TaxID=3015775 RepID=UPI002242B913|nr:glycosyltransferase [Alteromonas sp. ASW11-130]MCW8091276.1 glycosyltransferase [Alteromonas sp. ASW11-130]